MSFALILWLRFATLVVLTIYNFGFVLPTLFNGSDFNICLGILDVIFLVPMLGLFAYDWLQTIIRIYHRKNS